MPWTGRAWYNGSWATTAAWPRQTARDDEPGHGRPGELIARGGKATKIAVEVATHADEAVDATRLLKRTAEGLGRFKTAGQEVLPNVLKAFEGAVDYGAPIVPDAFKGRNVRTIGSLADTEAAAIERGARILDGPWSLDRNYDWIMEGVENGDVFELVTEVREGVLISEKYGISVFARE